MASAIQPNVISHRVHILMVVIMNSIPHRDGIFQNAEVS